MYCSRDRTLWLDILFVLCLITTQTCSFSFLSHDIRRLNSLSEVPYYRVSWRHIVSSPQSAPREIQFNGKSWISAPERNRRCPTSLHIADSLAWFFRWVKLSLLLAILFNVYHKKEIKFLFLIIFRKKLTRQLGTFECWAYKS